MKEDFRKRPIACAEFDRWLDDGADPSASASMRAHAERCPRCAESLRAAEAIERWLSLPTAAAPAGFTDHVLARIARVEGARAGVRAPAGAIEDPLPWWAAVLREPAIVLASVAFALVAWRIDALLAAAAAVAAWTTALAARVGPLATHAPPSLVPAGFAGWGTLAALLLALTPAMVMGALALERWASR